MKINLNDCVVIGESNKIFDIMLAYNTYLDNQIECSCYNDASNQAKGLYKAFASYLSEYYYLYDNTLDCTKNICP